MFFKPCSINRRREINVAISKNVSTLKNKHATALLRGICSRSFRLVSPRFTYMTSSGAMIVTMRRGLRIGGGFSFFSHDCQNVFSSRHVREECRGRACCVAASVINLRFSRYSHQRLSFLALFVYVFLDLH